MFSRFQGLVSNSLNLFNGLGEQITCFRFVFESCFLAVKKTSQAPHYWSPI
nr:hypothetical protein [uncultured bacterium]